MPLAALILCTHVVAAERPPAKERTVAKSHEPSPNEDDANLHDVQFVGSRHGWAVGDHGVIWHSEDGGDHWTLQNSGIHCPLRSVSFLSDRVGWIGGGGNVPFTRRSYGVVLKTTDGGRTWEPLVGPPAAVDTIHEHGKSNAASSAAKDTPAQAALPRVRKIKFFSPDEGIVVGEGTGNDPTGAFATDDGGKSWRPLPGKISPGWLGASFLNPDAGVLVGARGSVSLAVEGKIVAPRLEHLGVRGLYDVTLGAERSGWLVGDGGMVLQTANSGLVWQAPATPLPEGARSTFDFCAVCCRGDKVWVAGQPGSVIWHSRDAGQTWQKQTTGQPVPIARLHFLTDERGWAVGALGSILLTEDGGATWKAVHGGGRRVALMALFDQMQHVSLGLIAELSGDAGYRSLVAVVARDDDGTAGPGEAETSERLDEAVTSAGGSAGQIGWQLPLVIPGLERDFDRLVAEWNRRTENQLDEILTGALVRQLRTWRPSVLVIQQPESGNALVRLVGQAALKAVEQAADSTRFLEQHELAGLEPWQVLKVFVRLPAGSSGHVNVEPFQYLSHLGETTNQVASSAEGLFRERSDLKPTREAYRLVRSQWADGQGATIAGGLFAGVSIPAGGPARRASELMDDSDLDARRKIARQQRNFAAYAERYLDDSRHAGQLIAQLSETVRGMSGSQGAWQLTHLAEQFQASGQWELSELTLIELIKKFPDQPAALAAMKRLTQLWGSSEVTWRRLRKTGTEQRRDQNQPEASALAAIRQVEARLQKQARGPNSSVFDDNDNVADDSSSDEPEPQPAPGASVTSESRIVHKDLDQKFRFWQSRALKMAKAIERRDAAMAGEPSVQFPLAAIHRQRTSFLKSDEIYRRHVGQEFATPWSQAAAGEIWLSNALSPPAGPVTPCGFTPSRPVLDGVLSDPCWQDAAELPLVVSAKSRKGEGRPALVMLCYDAEFLYLAASLPRAKGVRTDGAVEGERRHDEDVADFDRVMFSLDVDRDYVTYFNFIVDQRGCTAESCWEDPSWNPRWLVAVGGDKTHWRLEAAIPMEELTPLVPQRGSAWAIGITRVIPAVGIESWTHPSSASLRAENFGILRFDAPGDPR